MIRFLFIVISIIFFNERVVEAYIGPGAGFAFISSFFILFITIFLAVLTIFFWPLCFASDGNGNFLNLNKS